jgi:hypothetical protein
MMKMESRSEVHDGRELQRTDWGAFFEELNRRMERGTNYEATIELATEEIVGPEAERLPLTGITYEDGDDEIAVGVGGRGGRFPAVLWHFVENPRQVWVQEEGDEPSTIAIRSEDGSLTLVRLYPE